MNDKTIAIFQISTEEDLRFQLDFTGLALTGRTLRVNVRERSTNTLKVALAAPGNLTLVGAGNLTVFYSKSSMTAWARGEYEADILDESGGSFTRIMAVRFVYDHPGNLVYGVRGNQATIAWGGNQAVVTAIGGVGPPGPVNQLTIPPGGVETVAPDQPAEVILGGASPNQTLSFKIPRGLTGYKGWSPVFAVTADGARSVLRLADWVGGEGTPPPITVSGNPLYVGASGLTTSLAAASDFRGAKGDKGDQGDKGWSPLLAMVPDGARRVLQIQDWTGGAGTKPATGGYLGPSGIVSAIGDATDFRGAPGASVGPGTIGTPELADGAVTEVKIASAYRATLATQTDLNGFTPRTGANNSSVISAGTTAQRDASPTAGYIRFNLTTEEYEGGNGSAWVPIGGGGALVADSPPTNNLREGLLWFSRSWGSLFIYYVDANGGHWISTTPVVDPSAFVLKGSAQVDLGFSSFMWGLRTAVDAAAARASLLTPWELIEQKSPVLNQTEIDFTNLPAGFDRFELVVDGLGHVNDATNLILRVQTGGSTWQTAGYAFGGNYTGPGGSTSGLGSTLDSYSQGILIGKTGNGLSNAAGATINAKISFNAKDANARRRFFITMDWLAPGSLELGGWMWGVYGSPAAITGVRLLSGSPQFKGQGNVKLMGLRA